VPLKEEYSNSPEQPAAAGPDNQYHSITTQTDSEIVLATIEPPLHQFVDNAAHVEEAYVSPAQENLEKERERDLSYPTWDART
jgi:hypothetical protein